MKKKHQLFSLVTLLLVTVTAISCRDNRKTNEAPNTDYPSDYETERQDEYMGTPTDDPMYAPDTLNGSMEGNADMREHTKDTIYHRTN